METEKPSGIMLFIAPMLCVLVAVAACFYQYRRGANVNAEIAKVDNEIAIVGRTLSASGDTPRPKRIAAALLSTDEQPAFVNWLRMTASFSRVQVIKWTNTKPPTPAPGSEEEKAANAKPLPPNIAAVTSAVEVNGRYNDIRDFLYSLLRAERVLTMTGIQWTRSDKWPVTKVSFTLTRYVNSIAGPPK